MHLLGSTVIFLFLCGVGTTTNDSVPIPTPSPVLTEQNSSVSWRATPVPCPRQPKLVPKKGKPKFQSQLGQDQVVDMLLPGRQDRYFVDLAANDPVCISNSYALEQYRGWHGLCIEGNPRYIPLLQKERACTVIHAAVDTEPNRTVQFRVDNNFLGGIVSPELANAKPKGKLISLQTRTFEEILDTNCAPPVIDYLSLDVEGAEWRVLANFPYHRYQFRIMTIERPNKPLAELLKQHGYYRAHSLGDAKRWGEQVWLNRNFSNTLSPRLLKALDASKLKRHRIHDCHKR